MATVKLDKKTQKQIKQCVEVYKAARVEFENIADSLHNSLIKDATLHSLIHSSKYRIKDPDHLKRKLQRKAGEAIRGGKKLVITSDNLFGKVNDLAGIRLLHLRTKQMKEIDKAIRAVLHRYNYVIVGKPEALTWDMENEAYFRGLGMKVSRRETLYTSVHYIIRPPTNPDRRIELQVRTLAEELWGEVDHSFNYPDPHGCVACKEQIKVLARVASSCSRLVDSIFASKAEYEKRKNGKGAAKKV